MNGAKNSTRCLTLLSQLLLGLNGNGGSQPNAAGVSARDCTNEVTATIASFGPQDFGELWGLAASHHVVMRAFPDLHRIMVEHGNQWAEAVDHAMAKERVRIEHALSFLYPICDSLKDAGKVIVIKSLDHWPDLGSDLDLFTNARSADVVAIMRERFKAHLEERSWGDRLANKWNFVVPGLPELVEVHVGRLGQTGEQVAVTNSLVQRAGTVELAGHTFPVPAPEERLIISTLQRMYRHFYLRLCDVVDTARLVESATIDYAYLKSLARSAGLWDGLATYLATVSGYVKSYRGVDLPLPSVVTDAARFGNELVSFRRKFLRIPIFPQAARLYASEWKRLLLNGELKSTLRLSLLPPLAAAAALEFKFTGTDKGIW
ncbi:MAG: hypothetical protein JWQ87_1074 [Candidatus Sulfotelmatobacter sp.]|nr:hypothetical protein [Candidatus Sulfotelmatobacter sp.]